MKKEQGEIIAIISEYLSNYPDQRFGQALFNLGINEFSNRLHPETENYQIRDIHSDSDEKILNRIKSQLDSYQRQKK